MKTARTFIICALLVSSLLLMVGAGGCMFGGDDEADTPTSAAGATSTSTPTQTTLTTIPVVLDELSTFESRDPFRQQALPPASNTSTTGGGGTTSTTGGGTTSTTTGGTTSTTKPSSVTTPVHSLKVLSIDVVNGVPVVTFEVDGVVYEDKKEGDVVSTSWGQIEVVEIDPDDQVVVLLHGSELRTLAVGQEFLK